MAEVLAFLRLPNLLIVALTQVLPYWLVLRPALLAGRAMPWFTPGHFALLTGATVLTTLAGYLINDMFDIPIDRINKPRKMAIGNWMPLWAGIALYLAIVFCSGWLAWRLYEIWPATAHATRQAPAIFPLTHLLLLLYAWQLKCTPLIGNILVALLCAVTPAMIVLPEIRAIQLATLEQPALMHDVTLILWAYAIFAFVTTLFREQIKALQDVEGDAACGCSTLPVQKGRRFAKIPAVFTGILLCGLILLTLIFWMSRGFSPLHVPLGALLLLVPAAWATFGTVQAFNRQDFRRISLFIKLIMLSGVLLLALPPQRFWHLFFPL